MIGTSQSTIPPLVGLGLPLNAEMGWGQVLPARAPLSVVVLGWCLLVLLILRDLGRGFSPLSFWLNLVSGGKNLT